jgi:subtilisin-like proprotein convertase family protein
MAKMNLRVLLGLVLALGGCALEPEPVGSDDQPVSDIGAILDGAPEDLGRAIPFDSKADEVIPAQYDLMDIQSRVQSQGSRGTCTIFATVALMESLYLREGTLTMPDFSEQHLQWSVKTEVRAFQNTEGSNPQQNLQAISRFGIVEESVWPYQTSPWGTSNDPACTGDSRPVRCYTNGEPPAAATTAQRFKLPAGRWINPSPRSIQGHMLSTRTPVVASGDFFYQAWNHGTSRLVTNSEYSRNGYVLSPNQEDIEDSSGARRAGHGFLLVGWDDNLEVPKVDGMGQQILDAEGQPVMERGFFLFKNSWGTGRFGANNPHGAGYGWIAYSYVEEYLTAYVAGVPEVMVPEQCNDTRDNDRDGQTDCDDSDCAADRACMDPADDYTNDTAMPIPDNAATGVTSTITIAEGGSISSLAVNVDIAHTYRGDLSVRLVRMEDGTSALLHDRAGGSEDDLVHTFTVADFNGTDAAGTYQLVVVDNAAQDTGTLRSWSLDITRCTTDCEGTPTARTYEDEVGEEIPDSTPSGLVRELEITDGGTITEMSVTVDITHSFPADLTIRLAREGGREFVILTEDYSSEGGIHRTFDVPGFVGAEAAGTWRLTVVDVAAADVGTLESWSLDIGVR